MFFKKTIMQLRLHYLIILLFTFSTTFSQVQTINTVGIFVVPPCPCTVIEETKIGVIVITASPAMCNQNTICYSRMQRRSRARERAESDA